MIFGRLTLCQISLVFTSKLPMLTIHLFPSLDLEPSSSSALESPAQFILEMPETVDARISAASDPQGELEPQVNAMVPFIVEPTLLVPRATPLLQVEDLVVPEMVEPNVLVPSPTPLLQVEDLVPEMVEPNVLVPQSTPILQDVLEEDLPTAADTQPPPDVAADAPNCGQGLLPDLAALEELDHDSSLPEINILLERFRMTCCMVASRVEIHFMSLPTKHPYLFLLIFFLCFIVFALFFRY